MERHDLSATMEDLKLHGMRASFDEITGKGFQRRDELYPLLTSLLRAEHNHRQARSIVYRVASAKFCVLKDLDASTSPIRRSTRARCVWTPPEVRPSSEGNFGGSCVRARNAHGSAADEAQHHQGWSAPRKIALAA